LKKARTESLEIDKDLGQRRIVLKDGPKKD
jgi:hypothetical protein